MIFWKKNIDVSKKELLVAFLGALLILFWNMKNSFEFGRLAFVPSYDDVSYFEDALSRYLKLINGNILFVICDAIRNPPHAPLIAFQAIFSYMVFGIHDWSPYLTNAWIPFLVLVIFLKLTNNFPLIRYSLFVYLMTLPMLGASIVEFRPDIAAGILTALCVVVATYAVVDECDDAILINARVFWSAILFGCALWAKPSAFIYNIGLILLGILLALVGLFISKSYCFRLGLKRAVTVIFIGLAVSSPYYFLAGRRVVEYTWNAVVRDKSIWEVNLDWWGHLIFYVFGQGGKFMLGLHVWTAIAATLLFAVAHPIFSAMQRLRLLVLIGVALGGFFVVAINTVKTQFLGVAFQSVWVIFTILVFLEIAKKYGDKFLVKILFTSLFFISFLAIQPTAFWGLRQSVQAKGVRNLIDEVTLELTREAGESNKSRSVFMTFTGFLNRDVLLYNLKKNGITSLQINTWFFRPKEEDPQLVFGAAYEHADIVIAASEGTLGADQYMPSNRILPMTLKMIQDNSNFVLLKTIPSGSGNIFIFTKKNKAEISS